MGYIKVFIQLLKSDVFIVKIKLVFVVTILVGFNKLHK